MVSKKTKKLSAIKSQQKKVFLTNKIKEQSTYIYLIFCCIHIILFNLSNIKKTETETYDQANIFFLLSGTYYYIISAIYEENLEKIKYSWCILIFLLIKMFFLYFLSDSKYLAIIILGCSLVLIYLHSKVIKKVEILFINKIKNLRRSEVYVLKKVNAEINRSRLYSLSFQLLIIEIDYFLSIFFNFKRKSLKIDLYFTFAVSKYLLLFFSRKLMSIKMKLVASLGYFSFAVYILLHSLINQNLKVFIDKEDYSISFFSKLIISVLLNSLISLFSLWDYWYIKENL